MTDYLDFTKSVAYEAGEIMQQYFLGNTQTTHKSDASPVTIADTSINQMVIDRVAATFPSHSVLGEEQSNMQGSDYVWVCDPIDGTRYYADGIALGTFMLSLVVNGVPQVAVIYEPITNKLFEAQKGKGAALNGKPIQVKQIGLEPKQYIDIGDVKDHQTADLRAAGTALYEKGIKIQGIRCSGMVGAMVAEGSIIAAITPTVYPHDIAATKLIVEEAGGKVTDIHGSEQRYDQPIKGAIISNGLVHDELIATIQRTL